MVVPNWHSVLYKYEIMVAGAGFEPTTSGL